MGWITFKNICVMSHILNLFACRLKSSARVLSVSRGLRDLRRRSYVMVNDVKLSQFGLGTKTTRLALGKDHGFGLK